MKCSLSPRNVRPYRAPVCYRARMSWILPTPLLLFAGVVALLPMATLVRQPTSAPRLVAEVVWIAPAVLLIESALWAIDSRVEQRR